MGLEGTGGFCFDVVAALMPWSEPTDFVDEFDVTLVSWTFSDDSRVMGFEGRAGTWGLGLGEGPSTSRNRDGRSGIEGCCFSEGSAGFDLVGRAGIWGFVVAANPVVARPSSLLSGSPAAAFSW